MKKYNLFRSILFCFFGAMYAPTGSSSSSHEVETCVYVDLNGLAGPIMQGLEFVAGPDLLDEIKGSLELHTGLKAIGWRIIQGSDEVSKTEQIHIQGSKLTLTALHSLDEMDKLMSRFSHIIMQKEYTHETPVEYDRQTVLDLLLDDGNTVSLFLSGVIRHLIPNDLNGLRGLFQMFFAQKDSDAPEETESVASFGFGESYEARNTERVFHMIGGNKKAFSVAPGLKTCTAKFANDLLAIHASIKNVYDGVETNDPIAIIEDFVKKNPPNYSGGSYVVHVDPMRCECVDIGVRIDKDFELKLTGLFINEADSFSDDLLDGRPEEELPPLEPNSFVDIIKYERLRLFILHNSNPFIVFELFERNGTLPDETRAQHAFAYIIQNIVPRLPALYRDSQGV